MLHDSTHYYRRPCCSFVQVLEHVVRKIVIMARDHILDVVQDISPHVTGTDVTSAWEDFSSATGHSTSTEDLYHGSLCHPRVAPDSARPWQGQRLATTMQKELNPT